MQTKIRRCVNVDIFRLGKLNVTYISDIVRVHSSATRPLDTRGFFTDMDVQR